MRQRKVLVAALLPLLILLTACPLLGQVTASFSLQPYKAVKSAFGSAVVTYDVQVCAAQSASADSDYGRVRQAAATKFPPTAAALVAPTISSARNKNKWIQASRALEVLSGLAAIFGAGQVIHMSTAALTAIVSVPPIAHELQGYFANQGPPDAAGFSSAFLPESGKLHLDAGACQGFLLQGGYVKGLQTFTVMVQ